MITNNTNVAIVPHANADPDALAAACTLAYAIKYMNNSAVVKVLIPEGIGMESKKIAEICGKYGVPILLIKKRIDVANEVLYKNSLCFLVDVASIEQVKILAEYFNRCGYIIVIDHHDFHNYGLNLTEDQHMLTFIDSKASSTSEIIFRILSFFNLSLPKDLLEMILAGIIWDTRRFLRASAETFECVAKLLEFGADYQKTQQLITLTKPYYTKTAKIKCVLRHRGYKISLGSTDLYMAISEVGAYESDCATALINIGYDIAIVASEEEEIKATRVVYRVRDDNTVLQIIDVYNDILKKVVQKLGGGGGGHRAAGAVVIGVPKASTIFREVIEIINELAGNRFVELVESKVL